MFMFRSKRTALAKRLWKAKVRREHDASSTPEGAGARAGAGAGGCGDGCGGGGALLLKRLKVADLETLVEAVESRGAGPAAGPAACVLLPRTPPLRDPHLLCCQMWRWPDVRQPSELKRLPACASTSTSDDQICCNPFHWSRLCRPESPPPPYSRFTKERLKPEDRAPSEPRGGCNDLEPLPACNPLRLHSPCSPCSPCSSLATNGEGADMRRGEWCKLAYWELASRVGRLFTVESLAVDVFGSQARGDGLCLDTLCGATGVGSVGPLSAELPMLAVRRTRSKIGFGLTLSHEGDGVWVYNRSEGPVFVNSPTLDDPDSRTLLVYRVPPGHCLNVFERCKADRAQAQRRQWELQQCSGPTDPNSVRISFAKGWGPKYSRQEVTACPCWLEVLLAPCR